MLKLLKLALVALISYAAYEFIRGLLSDEGDGGLGTNSTGPQSPLGKALTNDPGRSNITGPARGQRVTTEEISGESVPHFVGRGVIQR